MSDVDPAKVAGAFWDALYDRDWSRIRSFFGPESIYYDMPTGPSSAARGPDDIEARLRLGLAGLAGYEHQPGVVATAGDGIVMTEHTETWHWRTGESVTLPFVSVQHVTGEQIVLWKDYWDYNTLINGAPAWWVEEITTADLSWLFDATGIA
jgi:limonene-1,2-epoxide hydrolase